MLFWNGKIFSLDRGPTSSEHERCKSFILTFITIIFQSYVSGRDFLFERNVYWFELSMVWYTWYRLACYVVWKCEATCSLVWDRATQRHPFCKDKCGLNILFHCFLFRPEVVCVGRLYSPVQFYSVTQGVTWDIIQVASIAVFPVERELELWSVDWFVST